LSPTEGSDWTVEFAAGLLIIEAEGLLSGVDEPISSIREGAGLFTRFNPSLEPTNV
jgi:hypothetical protein